MAVRVALWLSLFAAATPASLALPSAMDAALRPEHSTADSTHEEMLAGAGLQMSPGGTLLKSWPLRVKAAKALLAADPE